MPITFKCEQCGKERTTNPRKYYSKNHHFCSMKCASIFKASLTKCNHFESFSRASIFYSPDGCHYWLGARLISGYGCIRGKRAHRIAYEMRYGQIPDGLGVLHRCDNILCVNPDHLFLGTQAENMADMISKNRSAKGSQHSQSKLTEADVIKIRSLFGEIKGEDIAKQFGINGSTLSSLRHGKTWKHV